MSSFTLKLGSFDLTPYCRMNPDDGFDPMGDPIQPAFGDTPMGDGQPLLNIQAGNKDFVIPLHLKAADKNTVNGLVRTLRETIDAKPVMLEWADVGATASTFFDVEWGKFNVEYNFRRAGYNYVSGTLHVYVRPYGHTGTTRIVGTFNQNGNQIGKTLTIPAASIQGDLAPLLDVKVWRSAGSVPTIGELTDTLTIISKLPSPSYQAIFKAVSGDFNQAFFPIGGPTIVAASQGVGSQSSQIKYTSFPTLANAQGMCNLELTPLSAYAGRNRIFALVNPVTAFSNWYVSAITHNVPQSSDIATVVASSAAGYYLVDLGTFDVPTSSTIPVPTTGEVFVTAFPATAATPTQTIKFELTEVLILPEDSTYLFDALAYGEGGFSLGGVKFAYADGVNNRAYGISDGAFVGSGVYAGDQAIPVDYGVRGDLRSVNLNTASGGDLLVVNTSSFNNDGSDYYAVTKSLSVTVKVRERFTYAR